MTDIPYIHFEFPPDDTSLHDIAAELLLSKHTCRYVFKQGSYSYRIQGGDEGWLCYRKAPRPDWIDVAWWSFYGAWLTIVYRKPLWLRRLYESLFSNMNFASVQFGEHTISVTDTEGNTMSHKRFRLIPPGGLTRVLVDKFGYTEERAQRLTQELKMPGT